ncbi:MAG: AMP-binding protein [Burkholderiaceae bacterium]|jgi:fatty-acyl-CoA synthase
MPLAGVIQSWARVQPERVALRCNGQETTWRRFWNRIERASARLATEWQVEPGARVAYLGFNRTEELILFFALARIGAILVPLNYRLVEPEWSAILKDAGARLLLYDAAFAQAAQRLSALADLNVQECEALIAEPCHGRPRYLPLTGAEPVLLVYTSGTTGAPRGVLHHQDGMLWNAAASIAAHDLVSSDHVLTVLPLFHVGGLCIQTIPALVAGATVTLHARFDAEKWLHEVAQSRPSLSLMVPATLRAVIEHPGFPSARLDSLRALMAGSSTIPTGLIEAFHQRGVPVGQVYGATETGPVSIVLRPADAMRKVGYAGFCALHSAVRLVDASGNDVRPGLIGEIWVQGRNLAQRYWGHIDPLASQNGWFASGDLARQDEDGCYEVVGRVKDMIISGGENIYPTELEGILLEHPDVADASVVGMADARYGEAPVAAIVLRAGAVGDAAAILALFEGRIARFKHPRQVLFLESLPKNAMGKVRKLELAARIRASSDS